MAGVAYPPGTNASDCRAIRYVAEACGFDVRYLMDEPTAAIMSWESRMALSSISAAAPQHCGPKRW